MRGSVSVLYSTRRVSLWILVRRVQAARKARNSVGLWKLPPEGECVESLGVSPTYLALSRRRRAPNPMFDPDKKNENTNSIKAMSFNTNDRDPQRRAQVLLEGLFVGSKAHLGIVHLQVTGCVLNFWIGIVLESHNSLHNLCKPICVSVAHSFPCNCVGDDQRQAERLIRSEYPVECSQDCHPANLLVPEMPAHHRCKCIDSELKLPWVRGRHFLGIQVVGELTKGWVQEGQGGDFTVRAGTVVQDTIFRLLILSEHIRL